MDNSRYVPLPDGPAAYKLVDPVTGRFYVGSTNNLNRRMRDHRALLRHGKHYNSLFRGRQLEEFQIEYVQHSSPEAARKHEDSLLQFHVNDDDMTNVATSAYSPWSSGNIPETHLQGLMSALEKARGLCKTPEALSKLSDSLKGRSFTDETRQMMSDSAKRRGNNMSPEAIQRGREKRSQPVIVDGVRYASAREAGRAYGICSHTVKAKALSDKFTNWIFEEKSS